MFPHTFPESSKCAPPRTPVGTHTRPRRPRGWASCRASWSPSAERRSPRRPHEGAWRAGLCAYPGLRLGAGRSRRISGRMSSGACHPILVEAQRCTAGLATVRRLLGINDHGVVRRPNRTPPPPPWRRQSQHRQLLCACVCENKAQDLQRRRRFHDHHDSAAPWPRGASMDLVSLWSVGALKRAAPVIGTLESPECAPQEAESNRRSAEGRPQRETKHGRTNLVVLQITESGHRDESGGCALDATRPWHCE